MNKEEFKEVLEEKLQISKYLNKSEQERITNNIYNYCDKKRVYKGVLSSQLDQMILFLKNIGFTHEETITTISNGASLLQSNKKDMLAKYLLLATLPDSNNIPMRKDLLINYPKYYVMGIKTMYARFEYLKEKNYPVTKWYLFKMTNKEFAGHFSISHDLLLKSYPFDYSKVKDLLDLPGNEELKAKKVNEKYGI